MQAASLSQLVLQEAERLRPQSVDVASVISDEVMQEDPPQPQPAAGEERDADKEKKAEIRKELDAIEAMLPSLTTAASSDTEVADLLGRKKQRAEVLRRELVSLRPPAVKRKTAVAAQAETDKKLQAAARELKALQTLVAARQTEVDQLRVESARQAAIVASIDQAVGEGAPRTPARSGSPSPPLPQSPEQWAAGLAAALPQDLAASFQGWMASITEEQTQRQWLAGPQQRE